jgi:hypothetical protein
VKALFGFNESGFLDMELRKYYDMFLLQSLPVVEELS